MSWLVILFRLPRTGWILGRAGVLGHLSQIELLPPWLRRLLSFVNFIIAGSSAKKDAGQALCDALQASGPAFIKFGQALATRADLIGPELANGLSQLQDSLPAFSGDVARRHIEKTTGRPVSDLFTDFNGDAVAAASIAQVHKAVLHDGQTVAVKLLRPHIAQRMQADIRFFRALAILVETVAPGLKRLKLVTAVEQFATLSEIELDLRMEAAAGGRLAENMAGDDGIRIPHIHIEHSTTDMLVMEWIDGVKIDDRIALEAAGHDIAAVTNIAAASFFNQVFRDGYFHGDMHPGNIFITGDGTLVPIDFGIMGQLDLKDRLFLAQLLVAILTRDYDKVASLHADAGMLPDDISLPLFSQNLRAVVDPVLGKSLGDISLGLVLGQILRLSTRFEISVQPQFTLLQKTMVMAEGVARSLNPNANMWELSKPLAEKWMADHAHPAAVLHRTITEVSSIIRRLPGVLDRLEQDPEPPAKQPYFAMIITSLLSVTAIVISLAALLR